MISRVRLFVTPWTVSCQAPPSMEFSRQEYWSGQPFPSPGHKRCRFDPWVRKIPWRRKWQPTPVFLPGKSLVGYSPWGHEEWDTTKRLNTTHHLQIDLQIQSNCNNKQDFFVGINKLTLNLFGKTKELKEPQNLKMRKKVGGFILSDFSIYHKAIIIKTVQCQQRYRPR